METRRHVATYPSIQSYLDDGGDLDAGTLVEVYGSVLGTVVATGIHDGTDGPEALFRARDHVLFSRLALGEGLSLEAGSAGQVTRHADGDILITLTEAAPTCELRLDVFGAAWGCGMARLVLTPDPGASDQPTADTRCAVALEIEGSVNDGNYLAQEIYWTGAAWAERLAYNVGAGEATTSAAALSGTEPTALEIFARGRGTTTAQDPLGTAQRNLPAAGAAPGGTINIAWMTDATDTTRVASVRVKADLPAPGAGDTATFKLSRASWAPILGRVV